MSPDVINMFAVPFAFSRYPQPASLNAALRAYFLAQAGGGKAANPRPLTYRNDALFESHFNLFREADPAVQELKRFCWDQLLAVIGKLNGYDVATLSRLQIYNDCWFHVTRRGGFFGLHNHPNASWSGVYCVESGKSDPDKKMSGVLSFVNPTISSAMHMDAGIARMQLPYGAHVANFSLEAGQLVIFPSWVLHDVKPFEGDGERITVAFNCWFTLPDPPASVPSAQAP
ncbi:MAG TPA: putative 2OG-Fe(II) oxygenase [Steroidobacteraceae bacterium]|nr:putative 2OG-Fe(II) oxygenase [Steroidobacteraceae bacterium]